MEVWNDPIKIVTGGIKLRMITDQEGISDNPISQIRKLRVRVTCPWGKTALKKSLRLDSIPKDDKKVLLLSLAIWEKRIVK